MSKMDDLFAKKKDTAPVLDLSKTTVRNKEDFRRLMEKVPDFKIKPERVPIESMKIREKKFKFKSTKSDVKAMKEPYAFMDPLPVEMNKLKINELANVTIDWKMLTSLRPKSKVEENYFGRIVELGKLEIKTRAQEKRQYLVDTQIRKTKNKSGIVETRILSCSECGEDFCNGKLCTKYTYDAFTRIPESVPTKASAKQVDLNAVDIQPGRRRIKRRSRSKSKTKKNGPAKKSKSPKKSGKRN